MSHRLVDLESTGDDHFAAKSSAGAALIQSVELLSPLCCSEDAVIDSGENSLLSDLLCSYPDQPFLTGLGCVFQLLGLHATSSSRFDDHVGQVDTGAVKLSELYIRGDKHLLRDSSRDVSDASEFIAKESTMSKSTRDAIPNKRENDDAKNAEPYEEKAICLDEGPIEDLDPKNFMKRFSKALNASGSSDSLEKYTEPTPENGLKSKDGGLKQFEKALNKPDAVEKATDSKLSITKTKRDDSRIATTKPSRNASVEQQSAEKSRTLNKAPPMSESAVNQKSSDTNPKRSSSITPIVANKSTPPDPNELARDIWTVILEGVLDEIRSRPDMHLPLGPNSQTDRRRSASVTSNQIDRVVSDVLTILKSKSTVHLKEHSQIVLNNEPKSSGVSVVSVRSGGKIEINQGLLSKIIRDVVDNALVKKQKSQSADAPKDTEWIEDRLAAIISTMVLKRIGSRKQLKRTEKSTEISPVHSRESEIIARITDEVLACIVPKNSKSQLTGDTIVSVQKNASRVSVLANDHPSIVSIFHKGDLVADSNTLIECIDKQLDKQAAKADTVGRSKSISDTTATQQSLRKLLPTTDPQLSHLPLYRAQEIRPTGAKIPRLIRQEYTMACINTFDDGSQTYEVLSPDPDNDVAMDGFTTKAKRFFKRSGGRRSRGGPMGDGRNLDAVFAILPDGRTVCFEQI